MFYKLNKKKRWATRELHELSFDFSMFANKKLHREIPRELKKHQPKLQFDYFLTDNPIVVSATEIQSDRKAMS